MTVHPLLARERPETCLSDLALDRWLAGDLTHSEGERLQAHLHGCASCTHRLRVIKTEPEILPPRAAVPRPRGRRATLAALGAAAAGVVLIAALVRDPGSALRAKGGLQLDVIVRRRDGRAEPVFAGDALSAGDAVGFVISTPEPGYAFVVGLDAAGAVSPYFPTVGVPRPLPAGHGQALPGSVILDDTPGAERFLLLHCNAATNVDVVVEAGRRALAAAGGDPRGVQRLDLPCRQVGLTVEKVRRP